MLIGFKEKNFLLISDNNIEPSFIFHRDSNKYLIHHKVQNGQVFICFNDENNLLENEGDAYDFEISLTDFLIETSK